MNLLFNICNKQIISMQILGKFENLYKPEIYMNYVREIETNENYWIQYDADTLIFVNFLYKKTGNLVNFYDIDFSEKFIPLVFAQK